MLFIRIWPRRVTVPPPIRVTAPRRGQKQEKHPLKLFSIILHPALNQKVHLILIFLLLKICISLYLQNNMFSENQQQCFTRQRIAYLDTDFKLFSLSKKIKISFFIHKVSTGEVKKKKRKVEEGKTVMLFTTCSLQIDQRL